MSVLLLEQTKACPSISIPSKPWVSSPCRLDETFSRKKEVNPASLRCAPEGFFAQKSASITSAAWTDTTLRNQEDAMKGLRGTFNQEAERKRQDEFFIYWVVMILLITKQDQYSKYSTHFQVPTIVSSWSWQFIWPIKLEFSHQREKGWRSRAWSAMDLAVFGVTIILLQHLNLSTSQFAS